MTKTLPRPSVTAPGVSRERLLRAMVQVVARHGYEGASISRVVASAGASRATFYEHFSNREECFLVAQRGVAERALRCIRAGSAPTVDLPVALNDALRCAVEHPDSTQLLLVEAAGASPAARREHEGFLAAVESVVEDSLPADNSLQLSAGALVDGVAGVLAMRLLRGESEAVPRLAEGMLAWARSYRLAPGEGRLAQCDWAALGRRLTPAEPGRLKDVTLLPRGRSAPSLAETAAIRHDRIVDATARVVSLKGFAASTVADIVSAARVPRSAFYAQFDGKQSAFLATQERILRDAMGAAAAQFVLGDSWPERVWKGLAGLLYHLAERPDLARLSLLEASAAGEEATLRSHSNCTAFTLFLEEGYRQDGSGAFLPSVCSAAIAFAINGIMRRALLHEGADRLPEALPQCAHLALAPFIGPRRSLEFVTEKARAVD